MTTPTALNANSLGDIIIQPPTREETDQPFVIYTSGTTGEPKGVEYTWERLTRQVRWSDDAVGQCWLTAYAPGSFAWYALRAHAIVHRSVVVQPPIYNGKFALDAVPVTATQFAVTAMSGTPTFWRHFVSYLWQHDEARLELAKRLRFITLGGEIADETLLNALGALFPTARITHVFATTELGSCFSVSDGRPGFPADYLNRKVGNVHIAVHSGQLYIGYGPNDLFFTGDVVEVVGDRVLFRGRAGDLINVGGRKVSAAKVEQLLLSIPGVQAARVYGQPNAVTGQVVVAEVELVKGERRAALEDRIQVMLDTRLERHERPMKLTIVNELPTTNGKIARRMDAPHD